MDAFETAIRKAIDSSLRSTIKGYIAEFAEVLTDKVNTDKNLKTDQVIDIWNNITKDFVVGTRKTKKEKDVDPSVPSCEHVFTKGERKDQQCCEKISKNSETKKFCSKHYKQNEKTEEKKGGRKSSSEDGSYCCYVLKKGERGGEECGKNTSKGSQFCSKHKGESKDKKKKNKSGDKKNKKGKKEKEEKNDPSPVKVTSKKIKTGDLKDLCYFEHKNVKFVFDPSNRIVKGTMDEEGKLVELTDDQVEFIEDMPPFQVEKKEKDEEVVEEKEEEGEEEGEITYHPLEEVDEIKKLEKENKKEKKDEEVEEEEEEEEADE